jgi:uncharacterized delta-60 repeat protein
LRRARFLAVTAALTLLAVASSRAAGGQLDQSFSGDGKRTITFSSVIGADDARAVAVQSDGKIVVAGRTDLGGAAGVDFAIVRLRPNGSLDPSFSQDGKRRIAFGGTRDDSGFAVAVQPSGRIVVAGLSEDAGVADFAVARMRPNGSLDPDFSGDGRRLVSFGPPGSDARAFSLALQGKGRIVLAGAADIGGASGIDYAVARLLPGGALDPSFSNDGERVQSFGNGGMTDQALGVAARAGKIVVVGTSMQPSTGSDLAIVRYRADGTLDPGFSGDGKRLQSFGSGFVVDQGAAVAIGQDGRIVVAGDTDTDPGPPVVPDFAIARYLADGTLDPSFSSDGKREVAFGSNADSALDLALQGDGRIVVAGLTVLGGPNADFAIARLTRGGKLDASFSSDGKRVQSFDNGNGADGAEGVALAPNGRIVVVGRSNQSAPTHEDFGIARFLGG